MTVEVKFRAEYQHFYQLIGGYFHQDRSEEYSGSPQSAIDDYVRSSHAIEVRDTVDEVERLLARNSDEKLEAILEDLDNNYAFEIDGYVARTWLEARRDRLAS